jgi:hypothetical protein
MPNWLLFWKSPEAVISDVFILSKVPLTNTIFVRGTVFITFHYLPQNHNQKTAVCIKAVPAVLIY